MYINLFWTVKKHLKPVLHKANIQQEENKGNMAQNNL